MRENVRKKLNAGPTEWPWLKLKLLGFKRPLSKKTNTEFILIKLVYLTRGLDKDFN